MSEGLKMTMLSNPNGVSYYNLAQASNPQHCICLDSSTHGQNGLFEPLLESFGVKIQEQGSLLVQKQINLLSTNYTKAYVSWLSVQHLDMQVIVQCALFDLHSNEFVKLKHGRAWEIEQTITWRMTQDYDRSVGMQTMWYKEICWRRE